MTYDVVCADVMDWAAGYEGEPFHAMLCDPPYSYCFMGKDWDDAVAMHTETWAVLAEHLLPGAFVMAFAGARTWHRQAVAMEDSGLIMHPSIFGWAYGSGFPKATRVGKYGTDQEWEACQYVWQGHRYGLQAMKPALEPILLFQKPWEGKRLDCIVETGAGALNVDGGRIGTEEITTHSRGDCTSFGKRPGERSAEESGRVTHQNRPEFIGHPRQGRWPANFALCHVSPDADGNGGCVRDGVRRVKTTVGWREKDRDVAVSSDDFFMGDRKKRSSAPMSYADADGRETVANWVCVEGCPVRRLGEQSGERPGVKPHIRGVGSDTKSDGIYGKGYGEGRDGTLKHNIPDRGTAARFFHNSDWSYEVAERLAGADAVRYQAKAGRKERNAGCDALLEQQIAYSNQQKAQLKRGEKLTSNVVGEISPNHNPHPTVKPIALTQWLATLLLPPDAYAPRRILVPFGGSGSEAIGAMLAGWEHITLVEMDSDYCDIANARLAWWAEQANGQMWPDVKEILKNAK